MRYARDLCVAGSRGPCSHMALGLDPRLAEIGLEHERDELGEGRAGMPAEPLARL